MQRPRFYFDLVRENDDDAFDEAAELACELSRCDSTINRVIFLAPHKQGTGWLDRLYKSKHGASIIRNLFKGYELKPGYPSFKIEVAKKYDVLTAKNDVVIVMGTASDFISKVEAIPTVKGIIAIPTLMESAPVQSWLIDYTPQRIRGDWTVHSV